MFFYFLKEYRKSMYIFCSWQSLCPTTFNEFFQRISFGFFEVFLQDIPRYKHLTGL